jgi:NADPH:quinone reductase-like Zn-dependent oxidoreductase
MRAATHERYGPPDVMQVVDVPTPEPDRGEVRVRVVASSVTRSDTGSRSLVYPFTRVLTGMRRPKKRIAGTEFAGVIDAVAGDVTEWAVGDEVFGIRSGSNAEYVGVRASGVIAAKPSALSFTEAAGIADGALLVLTCLKRALPVERKRVLVYGAAGSMGVAAGATRR